jgi:hypothetical protein
MSLELLAHVNPLPLLPTDTAILSVTVAHRLGLDGYRLPIERGWVVAMPAGDDGPDGLKVGARDHF